MALSEERHFARQRGALELETMLKAEKLSIGALSNKPLW